MNGISGKGEILLIPIGGLANRMRAIASALALSLESNKKLTVIWQRDRGLNANFNDIFQTQNLPFELKEISKLAYKTKFELPRKNNFFIPKIFHRFDKYKWIYQDYKWSHFMALHDADFFSLATNNKNIGIISGLEFFAYDYQMIPTLFRPTSSVTQRMEQITKGLSPNIAIHIRRTDNLQSINNSPLELFDKVIQEELINDRKENFFLASDDEATKQFFRDKYLSNIIINSTPARRDTLEGMIDALAEMLTMASCKRIYGSFYSSFSELAAQYYNNELIIVSQDPSNN